MQKLSIWVRSGSYNMNYYNSVFNVEKEKLNVILLILNVVDALFLACHVLTLVHRLE